MAKDPAFLFYPNDWIGGTMGMTFEEKGAYIDVLMMQFNRGHMTYDMIGQLVGQNLDKILDKFVKDEKGLYYNARLDEEQLKRKNFTKSRRNNITGNNQHTKNEEKQQGHKEAHMTSHMEDVNISTNIDNNINDKIKNSNLFRQPNIPTKEQVWQFFMGAGGTKEMAKGFYEKHDGTGWFLNNSPIVKWQSLANSYISNWLKNEENRKQKMNSTLSDPTKVKIILKADNAQ